MTKNDRMKIVRELFEYQFLRTYLPLPLTPLEQRELKNMLRKNPEILPSALPATLAQQAATNRHNATAGLSIQLDFFPSSATPAFEAVRRVGRQVFITDAARQSLFLFAVGSVVLALEFLSENSDDATQIVLGNVIVALATLVAYPALYLMHMEGASRERPIERPGAWSRMPPLREEEPESEEVITPRNHQESGDDDRNLSRADREPSRAAGSEVKHDDESVAGSDENLGSHENIESDEDESDDYIQSDESESDENVKLDLSSPRLSPSPRRTQVQWME